MTLPDHAQTDDNGSTDDASLWKEAIAAHFQPRLRRFFPAIHALISWTRPWEFPDAELRQIAGIREARGAGGLDS